MVLHSQLLPEIRSQGGRTSILCPCSDKESLVQFESSDLRLETASFRKSRWQVSLTDLRRYLREPIRDNPALWSRHQYLAAGSAGAFAKYRAKLNLQLHRCFFRSTIAHAVFDRVDRSAHRCREIRQALQRLSPDLLVSTYPVTSFEVAALLEAQDLGIPTVGHLLSWDNITCKGRFTAVPNWFISWGDVMTEELKEHYGIPSDRVFSCGVPHFDEHHHLVGHERKRQIMKDLGLRADRPYLFVGMSSPIFAPHEIDIVEWLAAQIRQDVFGDGTQLVVRPHPQNVVGYMADPTWLPRLKAVQGDRVALNFPRLSSGQLSWNMELDDLEVLVNLLSGCSVCLNSGSTLSIDAMSHGKPVVLTMFDGDRKDLPWWKSARRIREYPHYKKLLSLGGIPVADSFTSLSWFIQEFMRNPNHEIEIRQRALTRECCAIDGQSSIRVAESLGRIYEYERGSSD